MFHLNLSPTMCSRESNHRDHDHESSRCLHFQLLGRCFVVGMSVMASFCLNQNKVLHIQQMFQKYWDSLKKMHIFNWK